MPDPKFDALIIGGGHNGLTCAATLAKQGEDDGDYRSGLLEDDGHEDQERHRDGHDEQQDQPEEQLADHELEAIEEQRDHRSLRIDTYDPAHRLVLIHQLRNRHPRKQTVTFALWI
ncbi:MAG: hypothetical protein IH809_04240 [Proteobacteria bacterium]|nr:hypothetical protein [Pseudomonadota bacterium]